MGGSGLALFERSEFSQTPPDASSARKRKAPLAAARLFFAYFLYGEAKESEAPPVATGLQNGSIQQLHPMLHRRLRAALQMRDAADVGGDDDFGFHLV